MSSIVAAGTVGRGARKVSRKRGLSALEIATLVLLGAALIWAAVGVGASRSPEISTVSVRVESGDSLWALAQRHPVAGMSTEQTVDLIAKTNHLDRAGLVTGTEIMVPAKPGPVTTAMK